MNNWKREVSPPGLHSEFKFNSFKSAFAFMTRVAFEAEEMDHHPDWSNSYNVVKISLTTHSENAVTELDYELAERIDKIYADIGD